MPAKLGNYRAKRDFRRTPEPKGRRPQVQRLPGASSCRSTTRPGCTGTCGSSATACWSSWAIPNGIPMSPKENRLAVHVEDHPLDYIDFEGEIPEGNYGAGTVKIWDTGTYELEKWEPKKVIVTFHGERLQGKYALFQTRSTKDWMIHRMDPPADPDAGADARARRADAGQARGPCPPDERRYGFEIKWDGIRAITYYEPGRFRIESRNLNDITAQYPELRRLGRQLGSRDAMLDGEIVAFDERGRPSFERLQQRMHLTREAEIRRRAQEIPVHYMLFDVLYLEGRSLMDRPYEERREVLESMGLEGPAWQTPRYHRGEGAALLEASADQGLEGVVAKRLDSRYAPGQRSPAWIKVKNKQRTRARDRRLAAGEGARGAARRAAGRLPRRAGQRSATPAAWARAGTRRSARGWSELLAPLARERSPFEGKRGPRGARYVEPRLVAEIEFTEWTNDGVLRHPSYKGLVEARAESAVVRSARRQDAPVRRRRPCWTAGRRRASLGPRPEGRARTRSRWRSRAACLRLSNLDKVMYPKAGIHQGRPDRLLRADRACAASAPARPPADAEALSGRGGGQALLREAVPVAPARTGSRRRRSGAGTTRSNIDFCLVNDLPTLVWAANLADIELHTSLSLAEAVDRPTMMVFDLDPGAPANIVACCRVGLWLRDLFAELELESFAKTSGSKGLQVYVPLNSDEVTYDDTKPFARAVAELLEKQHPKQVVSRMTKSLRGGKVLIDWSQNDDHKTTVSVYSLRAKERPTVSTPVTWDEVEAASRRRSGKVLTFEHDEVLERVERDGDLFAPVLTLRQALPSL